MWIIIKAFNTAVGFKEWLEEKGIKDNNKRQAIAERLIKGEIISYGKASRLRYSVECNLVIFYVERKG